MKKTICRFTLSTLSVLFFSVNLQAATLIYSNDINADLEPCGCKTNPLGGMARRWNLIRSLGDEPLVQLDAGNLLFPTEQVPPALADQYRLKAEFLIRAFNEAGLLAAVPGEKDFALGTQVFSQLAKKAKFQYLAANATWKKGKLFKPYTVTKLKDTKVAILGLLGEKMKWPSDLKVSPATAAAKHWVPILRKQAQFVIVLTHQGFEKDETLATSVSGIDAIVGGGSKAFLQNPPTIGKTAIFQTSFQNQYVGIAPLAHPMDLTAHRLAPLDAKLDSPSDQKTPADLLLDEYKKAVSELNSKTDPALEKTSRCPPLIDFKPLLAVPSATLSNFDFWRTTPHAHALEPLANKNPFEIRNV